MAALAAPLGLGCSLTRSAGATRAKTSPLAVQLRSASIKSLRPAASTAGRPSSDAGLRVVAAGASKYAYVGRTDFSSSNGKMGLTYFGGEPKKANKSRLFVVLFVALGLPIIAAAGVVHNVAATAIASPTAPVLKGTYAVTMASVLLMYWASINVSVGRGKYKVRPPATTGVSEDFDRIFRVQANTIEQVVMFLPALWVFSLFVSPQIATAAGAIWIVGRVMYATGYYAKAASRGSGFGIASLASNFLIAGATFGVIKSITGL